MICKLHLAVLLIGVAWAATFLQGMKNHEVPFAANLPTIEIEALQSLYDSTNGPNWAWTATSVRWNFSGIPNPCLELWYGVNCTISASDGYLHVVGLVLNSWNLAGVLPGELGSFEELTALELSNNRLSGRLPLELSHLTQLQYLFLYSNNLTGTLPPELGNITPLRKLYMFSNQLTGTVPPELGSLAQLQYLNLDSNKLTGSLPRELGNMAQLQYFGLSINELTGTLPPELGKLTQLQDCELYNNSLSGTIPPELARLKNLQYLYLYSNGFTGTLPPELGELTELQYFALNTNGLTGTFPPELGNLTHLLILYLDANDLSGAFPSELSGLAELRDLDLSNNRFTGTLTAALQPSMLPNIIAINVAENRFSGTIADTMFQFQQLQYLNVGGNSLTGTLSKYVTTAKSLVYLSASYNHLWGCLPSVGGIKTLQEIDVSHNHLRCALNEVFEGNSSSSALLNVQIGDNEFTGTLPGALFSLPKLQTLVAVSNCFTGTLPEEICQATALQSLILDGVGASRSCPGVWTTWQLEGRLRILNRFHGIIPECVFSLPELTNLHLSGNNLVGGISESIILHHNLTELYLSHNLLTGSIPEAVQTHAWSQLDLSYNRFSGSLLPSFGVGTLQGLFNATANIVVNNSRLSGKIPATVMQLPQVSMLGTNMFSCKADKSDVPNTDGIGDKKRYQCGSDSFNYSFYLFVGLVGIATAAVYLIFRASRTASAESQFAFLDQWMIPITRLPARCQGFFTMMSVLYHVAVYSCVPLLLVLVPWYIAASHYYGTYTHQYAWVVSAAFLSGLAPGLVEFFLWAGMIFVVGRLIYRFAANIERAINRRTESRPATTAMIPTGIIADVMTDGIAFTNRVKAYTLFLGINLVVVIAANVAFVYVSLNEGSDAVFLAQVALSLFKFTWNTMSVPYLLDKVSARIMPSRISSGFFRVQAFVGLFNNVAIPCLVVAAQSPSCFRDVLFPPEDITSNFAVQNCQLVSSGEHSLVVDCSDPSLVPEQSSFAPQFSYNFQCSSSFVTYYSAAMLYFALTPAVLVPAVRLVLCWIVANTSTKSCVHQCCNALLPRLWRVPVPDSDQPGDGNAFLTGKYLNADNVLVNLNVYLGILLSFGVVFPPIALAMCVTMLSTAYQTRLAVGRLLCNAKIVGLHAQVREAIKQDCSNVVTLEKLKSVIVMANVFACYFYALFIFDTIGNAEGFAGACWVLALWVVVPMCAAVYNRYRQYGGRGEERSSGEFGLNLSLSSRSVNLEEGIRQHSASNPTALEMVDVEKSGKSRATLVGEGTTVSAMHAIDSGSG